MSFARDLWTKELNPKPLNWECRALSCAGCDPMPVLEAHRSAFACTAVEGAGRVSDVHMMRACTLFMYVVRFHVCRALQRVYTQGSSCGAAAPATTEEACDAACLTQGSCKDAARPDIDLQGADRDFCIYIFCFVCWHSPIAFRRDRHEVPLKRAFRGGSSWQKQSDMTTGSDWID